MNALRKVLVVDDDPVVGNSLGPVFDKGYAAPLIGLVGIVLFPFIGLAAIAAPFIGLVCIVFISLIRLARLAWSGVRAAVAADARQMRPVVELAVLVSMGGRAVAEPVPSEEL